MKVPIYWVDEEAPSLADSDTWPQLRVCVGFVVEAAPDLWLATLVYCLFLSITVWVFKDHEKPSNSLKY